MHSSHCIMQSMRMQWNTYTMFILSVVLVCNRSSSINTLNTQHVWVVVVWITAPHKQKQRIAHLKRLNVISDVQLLFDTFHSTPFWNTNKTAWRHLHIHMLIIVLQCYYKMYVYIKSNKNVYALRARCIILLISSQCIIVGIVGWLLESTVIVCCKNYDIVVLLPSPSQYYVTDNAVSPLSSGGFVFYVVHAMRCIGITFYQLWTIPFYHCTVPKIQFWYHTAACGYIIYDIAGQWTRV